MNPQHQLIDNACRIEVLNPDNRFTEEQKKELFGLLDVFRDTKITNVYKFSKRLKAFEDAFIRCGGNHDKLEESIKRIRDETYMQAVKAIPGIQIMKDPQRRKIYDRTKF